jgi:DNA-binding NtrC family response regulator
MTAMSDHLITAPVMEEKQDRISFQERHGIIGRSLEIREMVDTLMQVAPSDITVLITGESGTGKDVVARAIHAASRRAKRRFIPVNSGAIPEGILESELFGHEKGAFTGAADVRKGYFEIADGGTIFLDEIGDMPVSTQVKLLRVLESGEYMRVGSSEPRHADVRIIAATNKDLESEVREKRFRQDLFFRLRSVNLRIPPLRSRKVDIPLLVEAFVREMSRIHGRSIRITDSGLNALQCYPWPGNVRELKNFIESVAILEKEGEFDDAVITRHLPPIEPAIEDRSVPLVLNRTSEQAERELIFRVLIEIRGDILELRRLIEGLRTPSLPLPEWTPKNPDNTGNYEDFARTDEMNAVAVFDGRPLDEVEQLFIQRTLEKCEGNRRLAARTLNISERTLYRKIKEYGLP